MTAASVISSARYDLRDTDETEFTDAELLDYLNRGVVQLDALLAMTNSDWVHSTDSSTTLASGDTSVTAPSDMISIRSLWISTNALTEKTVDFIYYKQKFTSSGEPVYFAPEGTNIIFEREADDDYSLVIHYNASTGTLSTSSDMPYSDEFNDPLREAIIMQARNRNEVATDAGLYNFFMQNAIAKSFMRNKNFKRYRLDF